jgi:hypothetical protein
MATISFFEEKLVATKSRIPLPVRSVAFRALKPEEPISNSCLVWNWTDPRTTLPPPPPPPPLWQELKARLKIEAAQRDKIRVFINKLSWPREKKS